MQMHQITICLKQCSYIVDLAMCIQQNEPGEKCDLDRQGQTIGTIRKESYASTIKEDLLRK